MSGAATGNRMLIGVIAVVALLCLTAAWSLDFAGKPGSGGFLTVAAAAMGVLAPSALKQATHGKPEEDPDGQS